MAIHKTAVIEDGAVVHETAKIGPYVVIGPNVKIGAGTEIGAHCVVDGITTIGENCKVYAGVCIGLDPQDLRYKGEPTGVIIGNNTVIREYVTIHRATGEGFTTIGDNCFFMNYCHIAHNCQIGNNVILANGTTFAGHVNVGDGVVISGMCIIHQWVRIGRFCMVGGMTGSRVDLPPFTTCDGRPAQVRGLNVIGLRRNKVAANVRAALKQTYKLLYRSGLNHSQALVRIEAEVEPFDEIREVCEFVRSSKRGITGALSEGNDSKREQGELEEAPSEAI